MLLLLFCCFTDRHTDVKIDIEIVTFLTLREADALLKFCCCWLDTWDEGTLDEELAVQLRLVCGYVYKGFVLIANRCIGPSPFSAALFLVKEAWDK